MNSSLKKDMNEMSPKYAGQALQAEEREANRIYKRLKDVLQITQRFLVRSPSCTFTGWRHYSVLS